MISSARPDAADRADRQAASCRRGRARPKRALEWPQALAHKRRRRAEAEEPDASSACDRSSAPAAEYIGQARSVSCSSARCWLAIAGGVFVGLTIWYFGRDLPDYQQLAHYEPPITTRVHAGDGRLLAEYATERRVFVPIAAIPKRVINAFLSAEDKNFYSHHGVDPISMLRAAVTDVGRWRGNRRPVGASTITQQVAKNMLLSNELSIERKIKEILLATRIDDGAAEGPHPRALSERDLSRLRRLWRRRRRR